MRAVGVARRARRDDDLGKQRRMRRAAMLATGVVALGAAAALLTRGGPPDGGGAEVERGATVFRTCSACHTSGRGGADVDGPNLYGVVGARVAERRPRYGYTQALRDVGGIWTEARLDAWLTDPAAFAPGTAMHFQGLSDPRDRADVIAYLASQGPPPK